MRLNVYFKYAMEMENIHRFGDINVCLARKPLLCFLESIKKDCAICLSDEFVYFIVYQIGH